MGSSYQRRVSRRLGLLREYASFVDDRRTELLGFVSVTAVDVGWRMRGGKYTGELAVRLHIRGRKHSRASKTVGLAPSVLDGVPIDVIAAPEGERDRFQEIPDSDRRRVVDPLLGGICIAGENVGTLGIAVTSTLFGTCVLTARHVAGRTGHEVLQPAPNHEGIQTRRIGVVADYAGKYDTSLIATETAVTVGATLGLKRATGFASRADVEQLFASERVLTKSGMASGVTRGQIAAMGRRSITVKPRRGYEGDTISCPGDSGAVWMTMDGSIVGIHSEGDREPAQERAFVYLVDTLVSAWGLQVSA